MSKLIETIALILIIIGALNWGLVGLFGFNVVAMLFGETVIAKAVYTLVGVAGVYYAYIAAKAFK